MELIKDLGRDNNIIMKIMIFPLFLITEIIDVTWYIIAKNNDGITKPSIKNSFGWFVDYIE